MPYFALIIMFYHVKIACYQRLIRDFSKVSKPLSTLLCKDKEFFIDKEGECAFEMLKLSLIEPPILQSLN